MMKTMESFTLWNLRTSQIKNEGQNSRLSRKQGLRRQHTLQNSTRNKIYAHENDDNDDQAVDRELEEVQQKIQQLQKEKERFANQLQAKKKGFRKTRKT
jgi:hypothetical protein